VLVAMPALFVVAVGLPNVPPVGTALKEIAAPTTGWPVVGIERLHRKR